MLLPSAPGLPLIDTKYAPGVTSAVPNASGANSIMASPAPWGPTWHRAPRYRRTCSSSDPLPSTTCTARWPNAATRRARTPS
eukprot:5067511-Prymnesium_polylepis.2